MSIFKINMKTMIQKYVQAEFGVMYLILSLKRIRKLETI